MIYGEYDFSNHTRLNYFLDEDQATITALHEYSHLLLTRLSVNGLLLYCMKSILIELEQRDYNFYKSLTSYLILHMRKVHEAFAVFTECYYLMCSGKNFSDYLNDLKNNNKKYYEYVKPLVFILHYMKSEEDVNVVQEVYHAISLMCIDAMNTPILDMDPKIFTSNTNMRSVIGDVRLSSKLLPNSKFKKNISILKTAKNCQEIISNIDQLLIQVSTDYTEEEADNRLNKVKQFILAFFSNSVNIQNIEYKLSEIQNVEISTTDLFMDQLPLLDSKKIMRQMKKIDFNEILTILKDDYTMLMVGGEIGSLSTVKNMSKFMIEDLSHYEKMNCISVYSLAENTQYISTSTSLEIEKNINDNETIRMFATHIYNYDFSLRKIKSFSTNRKVLVYCDRTYRNTKPILEKLGKDQMFFTGLFFEGLLVLIFKINENNFLVWPCMKNQTGNISRALEKDFPNIILANESINDSKFDDEIIRSNKDYEDIRLFVNSLFFMQ